VIAGGNASERLAIEELIDDYARQANLGDIHARSLLFVEDAWILLFLEGDDEAREVFHGRAQISPVFAALRRFGRRMNVNCQRSVRLLGHNWATCESYAIAHHADPTEDAARSLLTYLRFVDDLVKHAGEWRFRERELHVLFREHRARLVTWTTPAISVRFSEPRQRLPSQSLLGAAARPWADRRLEAVRRARRSLMLQPSYSSARASQNSESRTSLLVRRSRSL
jgi:hypothetical protein